MPRSLSMKAPASAGVRPLSSGLKTLAVLDVLGTSPRPMKLAELTARIGGNRATVYQKVITLVEAGWVELDDEGAYRLTFHAARVGDAAFEQASLGERATAILQTLMRESGETASLAVISGTHVALAKRVEAQGVLRAEVHVGTTFSLEISASGRVLCAYAEPSLRRQLQAKGAVLPDSTVMEEVLVQKFAVSSGLEIPGILAIAVPVFNGAGHCMAALSLVTPASRFDVERLLPPMRDAAESLHVLVSGKA